MILRALYLLLLLMIPELAQAGTLFTPPGTDKSIEYLGDIFGAVGTLPVAGGDNTVSQMMLILNQVVLSLGFVIIAWTLFVSSIHTAHEGEVMGKKWSSIWIPLRGAAGMYLLLPSASGYSYIQIIVMWLVVQSIGAADNLWNQVLASVQQGGAINKTGPSTAEIYQQGTDTALKDIFKAKICESYLNSGTSGVPMNGRYIQFYRDLQNEKVGWGFPDTKTPVCGEVSLSPMAIAAGKALGATITDDQRKTLETSFADAIYTAQLSLETPALEVLTVIPGKDANGNWLYNDYGSVMLANQQLKALLSQAAKSAQESTSSPVKLQGVFKEAQSNGWIFAGSFYFMLVKNRSNNFASTSIGVSVNNSDNLVCKSFDAYCPDLKTNIDTYYNQYNSYVSDSIPSSVATSTLGVPAGLSNADSTTQQFFSPFSDGFKSALLSFTDTLSGQKSGQTQQDPLLAASQFGISLMSIIETTFWIALVAVLIIAAVANISKSLQPFGYAFDILVNLLLGIVLLMLALLWSAGVMLGIYLPLIPFLIFLFGGIAWMILVIEAMLASPLIALTLIVPSEDEIGKAGQALLILVGLFFRPSLMIVGYVVASKLLIVAIQMLNYGFKDVVQNSLESIGLFGAIALVVFYSGLLVTFVHESFSLIYVIPDKSLRWMGITPEGTSIAEQLKKIEGSAETGAGIGGKMAKGALVGAGKLAKKG